MVAVYTSGFGLFFDFAGLFYVCFGDFKSDEIHLVHLQQTFLSRRFEKSFGNRWHMKFIFLVRDFVFMRMVMLIWQKNCLRIENMTSKCRLYRHAHADFWHGDNLVYRLRTLSWSIEAVVRCLGSEEKRSIKKRRT